MMRDPMETPAHVRAAVARLHLDAPDVPNPEPADDLNRAFVDDDIVAAPLRIDLGVIDAAGRPVWLDLAPPTAKLTPDHVKQLAEDIDTIRRFDALIKYLDAYRADADNSNRLGHAILRAIDCTDVSEGPDIIHLARIALDGIIADAALRRAEIKARVAPYVESHQQ